MTKACVALIFAAAFAACGGSSNGGPDMTASVDMSSSACSAAGGHCIGVADSCTIGGNPANASTAMGCAGVCCVPPPPCDFPQCDGGACECATVGQLCLMSGQECTCMAASGTALREWSCTDL
jgi:hypothetical protein